MALEDNFDFQFKVILIGDFTVGKTCVVQHFASGVYSNEQQSTIGMDFILRSLDIDSKKVKMQVWDTAGQERFRTIMQSYYRSAHAAIIAYDITQRSSFESVPHWIDEVKKYGAADTVIMLMGTKSDLWEKRQVLFEEACAIAEKHGLLEALETSAKESRNINEVFELTAKELIARNSQLAFTSQPSFNRLQVINNLPVFTSLNLLRSVVNLVGTIYQDSQGASQGSQIVRLDSQGGSNTRQCPC